jgi:MFS family permease
LLTIGSLVMAKWADRFREGSWIVVATIAMGIAGILYGLSTSIVLAILLVTVSGFFNAPSSIARRVIMQRSTPREIRGLVFSAFAVVRDVTFLIGIALAGLADIIDVRILVVASSVVLVLTGLWTGWYRASAARRPSGGGRCRPFAVPPRRRRRPSSCAGRRWPTSTGWPVISRPSPGSMPNSAAR